MIQLRFSQKLELNQRNPLHAPLPSYDPSLPPRGRYAFTLIELLVVIVVIGILAGLLLPVFSRAKARAQSLSCLNHERQMGLALRMYVDENHVYPYWLGLGTYQYQGTGTLPLDANIGTWQQALEPYYQIKWYQNEFQCPAYRGLFDVYPDIGSYGYNAFGSDFSATSTCLGLGVSPGQTSYLLQSPVSDSQVLFPSEMVAITDARNFFGEDPKIGQPFWGYNWAQPGLHRPVPIAYTLQRPPQHGQSFNVLFCDGHMASMRVLDLFSLTKNAPIWNNDHQRHPECWGGWY